MTWSPPWMLDQQRKAIADAAGSSRRADAMLRAADQAGREAFGAFVEGGAPVEMARQFADGVHCFALAALCSYEADLS